jgi:3-oxoacyl-[acyl-carrier-protein] synthase-1
MGCRLSAPGLVCAAGSGRDALFTAALEGDKSGIRHLDALGRRFPAGRARDFAGGDEALPGMTAAALEQIRPEIEAAIAAFGAGRIGVCAGSCDNGSERSLSAHRDFFSSGAFPETYDIRFQGAARIAEYIGGYFGISGPCFTVAAACASSAGALVKGAELIESGLCDGVIAGGTDLASETALLGFAALEAVSPDVCNPFSKNRDGATLGEGAAFFLLRRGEDPGEKDGGLCIELLGWGESADAHHLTAPRPDGAGAEAAMRRALAAAGIEPRAVDYVNLHGTGTALNDQMEAAAISRVFGDAFPPVSSTKPVTGHTLGAAGALELAICWMTLASNSTKLPAHCWDGEPDEEMPPLNFARNRAAPPRICMSNSFAFGGCNISLIIGRNGR